ncbi:uncharacterized protein LOC113678607 [Pocillopora damicornis]|uniref:uncharacterized protein LOC113678607 n=1 Tax=Pocillopora damicornis TaxID=46731 RepID=UPI000F5575EC|nr:uncharacterized protein LOC113678607 [Pocillopora damicornis]
MEDENLSFVLLRNHPEFLEETAILLNSEWSKTLEGRDITHTRVIGHCRLNKVLGKPKASFLTCVVIGKAYRGCGLGRKLMQLTESYASQLGLTAIYLSTYNKYEFYKHLGYHECTQVTPIKASSSLFINSQLNLLGEQVGEGDNLTVNQGEYDLPHFSPENSVSRNQEAMFNELNQREKEQNIHQQQQEIDNDHGARERETTPPPPPPPPLSLQSPPSQLRSILAKSTWMMKELIS